MRRSSPSAWRPASPTSRSTSRLRSGVASAAYAGLESSPWSEPGRKYAPKGTGAIVSFELAAADGVEPAAAGAAFVDALSLHSHVANIGDVRSLVIHPASTTHAQLTAEQQRAAGVTPGLVRLAVGLEAIDDILADLEAGFAAAGAVGQSQAGARQGEAVAEPVA